MCFEGWFHEVVNGCPFLGLGSSENCHCRGSGAVHPGISGIGTDGLPAPPEAAGRRV